ncbi:unnamed protein product [Schistosoma margrebowiei]|uniref:Uncharacterized protein n=1 Tax=Schistosoma margrebowiei TaxID=48269 RepID=A0A183MLI0_9TREM|nr:unnamed protein product [Schistosoma margrebowiei]
MKLENLGPTGLYSIKPSILSTITTLNGDLAPSSKIFFIAAHLAISVNPIILCDVTILTNGNPDNRAISTASAVLPAFGGPSNNKVKGLYVSTSGSFTADTASRPISNACDTDSPHIIIPRGA